MDIEHIRNEICTALTKTNYDRELLKIETNDIPIVSFLRLLDDIVDEQFLHSPKDVPYISESRDKTNFAYAQDLVRVASWNINELCQAKIYDYLWIMTRQIEFAQKARCLYIHYIRSTQKEHEVFTALYKWA